MDNTQIYRGAVDLRPSARPTPPPTIPVGSSNRIYSTFGELSEEDRKRREAFMKEMQLQKELMSSTTGEVNVEGDRIYSHLDPKLFSGNEDENRALLAKGLNSGGLTTKIFNGQTYVFPVDPKTKQRGDLALAEVGSDGNIQKMRYTDNAELDLGPLGTMRVPFSTRSIGPDALEKIDTGKVTFDKNSAFLGDPLGLDKISTSIGNIFTEEDKSRINQGYYPKSWEDKDGNIGHNWWETGRDIGGAVGTAIVTGGLGAPAYVAGAASALPFAADYTSQADRGQITPSAAIGKTALDVASGAVGGQVIPNLAKGVLKEAGKKIGGMAAVDMLAGGGHSVIDQTQAERRNGYTTKDASTDYLNAQTGLGAIIGGIFSGVVNTGSAGLGTVASKMLNNKISGGTSASNPNKAVVGPDSELKNFVQKQRDKVTGQTVDNPQSLAQANEVEEMVTAAANEVKASGNTGRATATVTDPITGKLVPVYKSDEAVVTAKRWVDEAADVQKAIDNAIANSPVTKAAQVSGMQVSDATKTAIATNVLKPYLPEDKKIAKDVVTLVTSGNVGDIVNYVGVPEGGLKDVGRTFEAINNGSWVPTDEAKKTLGTENMQKVADGIDNTLVAQTNAKAEAINLIDNAKVTLAKKLENLTGATAEDAEKEAKRIIMTATGTSNYPAAVNKIVKGNAASDPQIFVSKIDEIITKELDKTNPELRTKVVAASADDMVFPDELVYPETGFNETNVQAEGYNATVVNGIIPFLEIGAIDDAVQLVKDAGLTETQAIVAVTSALESWSNIDNTVPTIVDGKTFIDWKAVDEAKSFDPKNEIKPVILTYNNQAIASVPTESIVPAGTTIVGNNETTTKAIILSQHKDMTAVGREEIFQSIVDQNPNLTLPQVKAVAAEIKKDLIAKEPKISVDKYLQPDDKKTLTVPDLNKKLTQDAEARKVLEKEEKRKANKTEKEHKATLIKAEKEAKEKASTTKKSNNPAKDKSIGDRKQVKRGDAVITYPKAKPIIPFIDDAFIMTKPDLEEKYSKKFNISEDRVRLAGEHLTNQIELIDEKIAEAKRAGLTEPTEFYIENPFDYKETTLIVKYEFWDDKLRPLTTQAPAVKTDGGTTIEFKPFATGDLAADYMHAIFNFNSTTTGDGDAAIISQALNENYGLTPDDIANIQLIAAQDIQAQYMVAAATNPANSKRVYVVTPKAKAEIKNLVGKAKNRKRLNTPGAKKPKNDKLELLKKALETPFKPYKEPSPKYTVDINVIDEIVNLFKSTGKNYTITEIQKVFFNESAKLQQLFPYEKIFEKDNITPLLSRINKFYKDPYISTSRFESAMPGTAYPLGIKNSKFGYINISNIASDSYTPVVPHEILHLVEATIKYTTSDLSSPNYNYNKELIEDLNELQLMLSEARRPYIGKETASSHFLWYGIETTDNIQGFEAKDPKELITIMLTQPELALFAHQIPIDPNSRLGQKYGNDKKVHSVYDVFVALMNDFLLKAVAKIPALRKTLNDAPELSAYNVMANMLNYHDQMIHGKYPDVLPVPPSLLGLNDATIPAAPSRTGQQIATASIPFMFAPFDEDKDNNYTLYAGLPMLMVLGSKYGRKAIKDGLIETKLGSKIASGHVFDPEHYEKSILKSAEYNKLVTETTQKLAREGATAEEIDEALKAITEPYVATMLNEAKKLDDPFVIRGTTAQKALKNPYWNSIYKSMGEADEIAGEQIKPVSNAIASFTKEAPAEVKNGLLFANLKAYTAYVDFLKNRPAANATPLEKSEFSASVELFKRDMFDKFIFPELNNVGYGREDALFLWGNFREIMNAKSLVDVNSRVNHELSGIPYQADGLFPQLGNMVSFVDLMEIKPEVVARVEAKKVAVNNHKLLIKNAKSLVKEGQMTDAEADVYIRIEQDAINKINQDIETETLKSINKVINKAERFFEESISSNYIHTRAADNVNKKNAPYGVTLKAELVDENGNMVRLSPGKMPINFHGKFLNEKDRTAAVNKYLTSRGAKQDYKKEWYFTDESGTKYHIREANFNIKDNKGIATQSKEDVAKAIDELIKTADIIKKGTQADVLQKQLGGLELTLKTAEQDLLDNAGRYEMDEFAEIQETIAEGLTTLEQIRMTDDIGNAGEILQDLNERIHKTSSGNNGLGLSALRHTNADGWQTSLSGKEYGADDFLKAFNTQIENQVGAFQKQAALKTTHEMLGDLRAKGLEDTATGLSLQSFLKDITAPSVASHWALDVAQFITGLSSAFMIGFNPATMAKNFNSNIFYHALANQDIYGGTKAYKLGWDYLSNTWKDRQMIGRALTGKTSNVGLDYFKKSQDYLLNFDHATKLHADASMGWDEVSLKADLKNSLLNRGVIQESIMGDLSRTPSDNSFVRGAQKVEEYSHFLNRVPDVISRTTMMNNLIDIEVSKMNIDYNNPAAVEEGIKTAANNISARIDATFGKFSPLYKSDLERKAMNFAGGILKPFMLYTGPAAAATHLWIDKYSKLASAVAGEKSLLGKETKKNIGQVGALIALGGLMGGTTFLQGVNDAYNFAEVFKGAENDQDKLVPETMDGNFVTKIENDVRTTLMQNWDMTADEADRLLLAVRKGAPTAFLNRNVAQEESFFQTFSPVMGQVAIQTYDMLKRRDGGVTAAGEKFILKGVWKNFTTATQNLMRGGTKYKDVEIDGEGYDLMDFAAESLLGPKVTTTTGRTEDWRRNVALTGPANREKFAKTFVSNGGFMITSKLPKDKLIATKEMGELSPLLYNEFVEQISNPKIVAGMEYSTRLLDNVMEESQSELGIILGKGNYADENQSEFVNRQINSLKRSMSKAYLETASGRAWEKVSQTKQGKKFTEKYNVRQKNTNAKLDQQLIAAQNVLSNVYKGDRGKLSRLAKDEKNYGKIALVAGLSKKVRTQEQRDALRKLAYRLFELTE